MTIQQALAEGIQRHQAGQLAEAESFYRQVLAHQPQNPDALHLLGVIAQQVGRSDLAVELISKAVAAEPARADFKINLGVALTTCQKFVQAVDVLQSAIFIDPNSADAFNNLGNALAANGQTEQAIAAYQKAIKLRHGHVDAWVNLARLLKDSQRLNEAEMAAQSALHIAPKHPELHLILGSLWQQQGKIEQAIHAFRHAIAIKPDSAEAHNHLGAALVAMLQHDQAAASFRQAIEIQKDFVPAWSNLALVLLLRGKLAESLAAIKEALRIQPSFAGGYIILSDILYAQGRLNEATAAADDAIKLNPNLPAAYNSLGNTLWRQGKLDEALAAFQAACHLQPKLADPWANIGNVLAEQGDIKGAIQAYRKAISLDPNSTVAYSNLLYSLHYDPQYDATMIYQEHRYWNEQLLLSIRPPTATFANDRNPDRRLRIGYVSPDLHDHPVGRFLLPLLEGHDANSFEIYCYADVLRPDAFTQRLRSAADHWRNAVGLNDQELAQRIRDDQIDILFDLAAHTAGNRLSMFALKPSPVQVTYLAYCSTTGLDAMDYRISDSYLDPPAADLSCYSENTLRLAHSYWCYRPPEVAPEISSTPAINQEAGITFGCLNNFRKISQPALEAWRRILSVVPNSRFILHSRSGSHRQRIIDFFRTNEIDHARLEFFDGGPVQTYLAEYQKIDIALDPFPYNGGTTTCDALWMGVPVITLKGRTAVGRSGSSILNNAGLSELVAETIDQYVQIAITLSNDVNRRMDYRMTLRNRLRASKLMDESDFTESFEQLCRHAWRDWCAKSKNIDPAQ